MFAVAGAVVPVCKPRVFQVFDRCVEYGGFVGRDCHSECSSLFFGFHCCRFFMCCRIKCGGIDVALPTSMSAGLTFLVAARAAGPLDSHE